MKRGILLFLMLLMVLPIVNAQFYDSYGFYDYFGFGYYGDMGFIMMRGAIFILLFAFISKGTGRMFPENKAAGAIVALTISLIAVAFIPAEFVEVLGTASGYVGITILLIAVLLIPWLILTAFNLDKSLGKGKVLVYLVLLFLEGLGVGRFIVGQPFTSDIMNNLSSLVSGYLNKFLLVIGGLIIIYVIYQLVQRVKSNP